MKPKSQIWHVSFRENEKKKKKFGQIIRSQTVSKAKEIRVKQKSGKRDLFEGSQTFSKAIEKRGKQKISKEFLREKKLEISEATQKNKIPMHYHNTFFYTEAKLHFAHTSKNMNGNATGKN